MDRPRGRWLTPLLLVLAVAGSALLFQWQYRHDNKYTAPRPEGRSGVLWMEDEAVWSDPGLLLHLVDGWEVYTGKLLAPEEIAHHSPDRYVVLGQYGGLNLGERERSVYGDATYRATLFTDGVTRTYGMELPEIYSACRLWVNGAELARMGVVGEGYHPAIGGGFLSFQAGERIEIVVQVSDHDGYYSGMVYPPAFGTTTAVQRVLNGRVLTHGCAWAVALLLGTFSLFPWPGWRQGGRRQLLLALFCLCFILYTGYPLLHGWGLTGNLWYGVERTGRQLMTVCLLLLTGELCGVPRRIVYPAACAGGLVALLMLQPQILPGWEQGGIYLVSAVLRWWHRIAAALLVALGGWGLWRRRIASTGLLAGALVFACATVMDQMHSYYEPILTGFYAETAGFLILLILGGVMRWEARASLLERAALRDGRDLLEQRIDFQRKAMEQERAYTRQVHTMRHDMRGTLGLLAGYLEQGRTGEAKAHLAALLQKTQQEAPLVRYTGHRLIDDVLNPRLAEAKGLGARVSCSASAVSEALPVEDADLMRVLLNLLDNALEALAEVEPDARVLTLRVVHRNQHLSISCANSFAAPPEERNGHYVSRKAERGHGLGLSLVDEVAKQYGGHTIITTDGPLFKVQVLLHLPIPEE